MEERRKTAINRRSARNRHLYDDLNKAISNEKIIDFNTQAKIDLELLEAAPKMTRTRNIEKKEKEEEKIYDINTVLEKARQNRPEEEGRKKYQAEDYNILADLNKKYMSSKEEEKEEDDNDLELMKDLLETNRDIHKEFEKNLLETKDKTLINVSDTGSLVNSFYTRSMDLSEDDFEIKELMASERKTKRKVVVLAAGIIILLLIIITLFILNKLNFI